MINFEFHNPAKIIFGKGEEKKVAEYVRVYGSRVLLVYGGGSIMRSGLYDTVVGALVENGIEFYELGGAQPNPRLSLVREGIRLCREKDVDFILAVGGGSTIDSAKAIAAGAMTDGDIWDFYLDGSRKITQALPIGVILTIPAAGSESSDSSVVTNEADGLKRYISSSALIPRFAILNPELTYSMPKYQIACGASDILAHLMERYFTQVDHVDFTDRLIEAAIRTVLFNAPEALAYPTDYNVRAELMWVGTIAHNNLLNTGRIGDWASHDIEHELSGMYDIAHGAGLSIVFPAWMKYVYHDNIDKFIQFAVRVFDIDLSFDEKDKIVLSMIERLEAWYRQMGLPTRLADVGIHEDKLAEMADKCLIGRESIGNFRKLGADDVYKIYRLAL